MPDVLQPALEHVLPVAVFLVAITVTAEVAQGRPARPVRDMWAP